MGYEEWDDYLGSEPLPLGREVMPMADFSPARRAKIGVLVREPHPPERWLSLGLASITSRAWYEWHWYRGIDPDARRPKLSATLRDRVIERDGLVCGICGCDVEREDVHVDHILPWSRGGRDSLSNLQVSHSRCNLRKGASV